jgi:hypothetical protein
MEKNNKKGLSIMIGYVLLVTAAIVIGTIVYSWIITYVPSEGKSCPEDVSVFLREYDCIDGESLNLTLKNNGKFDIAGIFIYSSNNAEEEIASIDLSDYLDEGGINTNSVILFVSTSENSFGTNQEKMISFDLTEYSGTISFLEIIPARFQENKNKLEFITCGNSKIKEKITCS